MIPKQTQLYLHFSDHLLTNGSFRLGYYHLQAVFKEFGSFQITATAIKETADEFASFTLMLQSKFKANSKQIQSKFNEVDDRKDIIFAFFNLTDFNQV